MLKLLIFLVLSKLKYRIDVFLIKKIRDKAENLRIRNFFILFWIGLGLKFAKLGIGVNRC
jgi:hypothetical protein